MSVAQVHTGLLLCPAGSGQQKTAAVTFRHRDVAVRGALLVEDLGSKSHCPEAITQFGAIIAREIMLGKMKVKREA